MNTKLLIIILPLLTITFSACCWLDGDIKELCDYEVFVETRIVPLENTYTVNTSEPFIEAAVLTASKIRQALSIDEDRFEIERIELTSAQISYMRHPDNVAGGVYVTTAVVGNTFNQLLLQKENLLLPLYDIPGTGFTEPVNINEILSGVAITELKNVLLNYATLLNDEGISFILLGQSAPANQLVHFDLKFKLNLSIVYSVCRFVPIGSGQGPCE